MALRNWIVADLAWAEYGAAGENLLYLHSHGATCCKANAFKLHEDLGATSCNDTGLIVMSHICYPKAWKPTLNNAGVRGLSSYMGLVFGAVQSTCPKAMVVMLSRPSDNAASEIARNSPGKRIVTSKLGPLPFDFQAKACNHEEENAATIWQGNVHIASYSEGDNAAMTAVAHSSQHLNLVDVIVMANQTQKKLLFLGEWDAELARRLGEHIIGLQPRLPPVQDWWRHPFRRGWTYNDYFQWVKNVAHPYDTDEQQALVTAIMWHQETVKAWQAQWPVALHAMD